MTEKINSQSYFLIAVRRLKYLLLSQLHYYDHRLLRRTLHRSVTIFDNVRQSTLSLSKGSVHRPAILLSKAWQFILSLSKDRTLHRSVILFNKFLAETQRTQRKGAAISAPQRATPFDHFKKNSRLLSIVNCLLPIAVTFIISSCSVGKQYQQPQLELPKQFTTVSYADTSSIADIQWRKFFTDTSLQGLIDRGLTYNHDLLMTVKRMEVAQQRVAQAKLLQLPELNFQLTGQYSRPSNNSLNGISIKNFLKSSHVENYSALVSLSWETDIWGKIRGQKETVLAEYLQTYEATKAVQTQLVADIAQGYFNLLMLDKQLEIAKKKFSIKR